MPCCLCAIAARGHVAPTAAPILGGIIENAQAAGVGAATNSRQLPGNERVGRRLHDGNYETGEGAADGDERPPESSIRLEVDATRATPPAADAVALGPGIHPAPPA